ncbi:hypothetical protein B0H21DRAFT_822820 [Amylocystis lapponica]|nr:hypothetical protein B0H21DRAFT_822820 [Amylocystis lapponica]
MPLVLHRVAVDSPDRRELLPKLLSLSNIIFSPDPDSKYASLALWQERLSYPSSVIIYLSPPSLPTEPVAFVFAYPRTHAVPLIDGEQHSTHIWLAGVMPQRRKEGCLAQMVDAMEYTSALTVCTTPARFPDMWNWLMHRGWTVERDLDEGKVMLRKSAS